MLIHTPKLLRRSGKTEKWIPFQILGYRQMRNQNSLQLGADLQEGRRLRRNIVF